MVSMIHRIVAAEIFIHDGCDQAAAWVFHDMEGKGSKKSKVKG